MTDTSNANALSYMQKADSAIRDLLLSFECQPILFVGSGLSRRYFGAPNWNELLKRIFNLLPGGENNYEYHRQKYNDDPILIGSALSEIVFEWAWKEGRPNFPEEFFSSGVSKNRFIKHLACEIIEECTPEVGGVDLSFSRELVALSDIKPHAIITTNYDMFLEEIFEGYETITGQTILRYNTNSFGEIFHIHGDISNPSTIVLTADDYGEWKDKKKYVSAKLLTYFAEHPVFIFGYGLGDANVKAILRDIGELVADETGLIPNVYQIIWQSADLPKYPSDQAIFSVDDKEYRTKAIYTNDLRWVFDALKSQSALTSINPKLVRALAARMMKLVRHDIPSGNVSVDYDILERVADDNDELPTLLGISSINNPNQSHPLTITQVAQRLGFGHWSGANRLINRIKDEKGIDLRSSDNSYHCRIRTGNSSAARKWSHKSVDLLSKLIAGEDYSIDI